MAELFRSKVEKHLACFVCLKQLEDPKVLPCLYSYCHGCINCKTGQLTVYEKLQQNKKQSEISELMVIPS